MHSTFSKHMHDFSVSDTGENKQQAAMIGGAAAAGGVGLLAIIALVFVFVKYRIARLLMNRNKVGDLYTTQDEQLSRRNAYIQDDDTIEKEGSMRDIRQWSDTYFPPVGCRISSHSPLSRFGHLGIVPYETAHRSEAWGVQMYARKDREFVYVRKQWLHLQVLALSLIQVPKCDQLFTETFTKDNLSLN